GSRPTTPREYRSRSLQRGASSRLFAWEGRNRSQSLKLARGILSERLADRLGLTQFEAVHADFEHRAAFLHHDAAPGPRRAREIHVERVVSDAGDRFGRDYLARLSSVELVDGSLAGAQSIDGERDRLALAHPLT